MVGFAKCIYAFKMADDFRVLIALMDVQQKAKAVTEHEVVGHRMTLIVGQTQLQPDGLRHRSLKVAVVGA